MSSQEKKYIKDDKVDKVDKDIKIVIQQPKPLLEQFTQSIKFVLVLYLLYIFFFRHLDSNDLKDIPSAIKRIILNTHQNAKDIADITSNVALLTYKTLDITVRSSYDIIKSAKNNPKKTLFFGFIGYGICLSLGFSPQISIASIIFVRFAVPILYNYAKYLLDIRKNKY